MSAEAWKAGLRCTRAEAEAVLAAALPGDPVAVASEPDPAAPDRWTAELYLAGPPDAALLAAFAALVPSAARAPAVERLPDADWVAESQRGLTPIRAGRFLVHTAAHEREVPPDAVPFRIEAGRAFGTGHHGTTAGCLQWLDRLERDGARFDSVADVGTGTGLLAFAAHALWPAARVVATDIDPVAVEVAAANMAANGIAPGAIALGTADGAAGPLLGQGGFGLVIANILAGPLRAMAGDLVGLTRPGGTILLAGLLDGQAAEVAAAYARHGAAERGRTSRDGWTVLVLVNAR